MITYHDQLEKVLAAAPDLGEAFAALPNLEAVLKWLPNLDGLDSVQQDEYSYDILLPQDGEGRWIVFGVT